MLQQLSPVLSQKPQVSPQMQTEHKDTVEGKKITGRTTTPPPTTTLLLPCHFSQQYLHITPLEPLILITNSYTFVFGDVSYLCVCDVAASKVTTIKFISPREKNNSNVLHGQHSISELFKGAVICYVFRVVQIRKALQDQQWLFETLTMQVDERKSAVENTAKQIEDRLVPDPELSRFCHKM